MRHLPFRQLTVLGLLTIAAGAATLRAQSGVPFKTVAQGVVPPGPAPRFQGAFGMGLDASGNIYVDSTAIQKVAPDRTITDLTDKVGVNPTGFDVDAAGNSYLVESVVGYVYQMTPTGDLTKIFPVGGGASPMQVSTSVMTDPGGVVYVGAVNGIWKITSGTAVRIAGGGSGFNPPADGPNGTASFAAPITGMAMSATGIIYVTTQGNVIRQVTPDGVTTTVAGSFNLNQTGSADGVGTAARFNKPSGLAVDSAGNLYIADTGNHTIRKMATDGTVTTIAGSVGTAGSADGAAAAATFTGPYDLAFDASGTLWIADGSIRTLSGGTVATWLALPPSVSAPGASSRLTTASGVAVGTAAWKFVADAANNTIHLFTGGDASPSERVFAGQPASAGSADGSAAATATFSGVTDVVYDGADTAYLTDGHSVRTIAPDGTVTTLASGLGALRAITRDPSGSLFIIDQCQVKKVTAAGTVTVFAGSGSCGVVDGAPGVAAFTFLVRDIVADSSGTLYVADGSAVRRVATDGTVTTLAGNGAQTGTADGTGSAARFANVNAVALGADGTIYAGDMERIRAITPAGVVTTLAGLSGTLGISDGDGSAAHFRTVTGLAMGNDGLLYAMDDNRLRTVTTAGHVTTIAGSVSPGHFDGTGSAARFSATQVAAAPAGVLVVENDRVRAATPAGVVTTFLLDTGGSSDGAFTADARFNGPTGIALAPDGSLIVADTGNHTIRRVLSGIVSTVAGAPGSSGLVNATGSSARFNGPRGVAVDASGVIYVADTGNNAVRKISGAAVTTLASGFNAPRGVAVDGSGTVYVADTGNHVIRAISSGGTVSLFAGAVGVSGSADGSAANARFSSPAGVAVAADGSTIYVADAGNSTIRAIAGGTVSTIGGTAGSSGFADAAGSAARFNDPEAVTLDPSGGGLYIADTGNIALRYGVVGTAMAPAATVTPTAAAVSLHGTVQLTCAVTGTPTPSIHWEGSSAIGTISGLANDATYSGVDTPTLTITNAPASLNGAKFDCAAVNSAGGAKSSLVTLTVKVFTVAPTKLGFTLFSPPGGGASSKTPDQTVTVMWADAGAPPWTVSADQPWLTITNGSGNGSGSFTVGLDSSFGSSGPNVTSGTLTLTSSADPQLVVKVPVSANRVTVDAPPVGVMDTPVANATGLSGSLAVTGWAVDDVAIDHVEIWRDAVAGETTPVFTGSGPGNGKIFIANAIFVPGARPDILAAMGNLPGAYSAGWGYMLLTQGLWNQGNGRFTLYAFAFDKAGSYSTIGNKTITIDNANATKPFGTIDTPSYGGTVSGTIQNFGWALTPGTTCSISNPNVLMSIDSGTLTPVVYGDNRTDIAGAFPGYTNAAAAGGHFTLDTTTLANGMHTIGWLVTDSCGRADGIGSRFFTVANAASISMPDLKTRPTTDVTDAGRGFNSGTPGADVGRSFGSGALASDGTRVVRVAQTERIEVLLPGDVPYTAGLLPIGSTFDAATNTFMWQPAAGFLGAYDLSFTAGSRVEKLRVVVGPPIRMVIDTPHANSVLDASGFTIAGWAVDLGSPDGAGVDTLHVWAYPAAGGAPVFVGIAKSGGARPDVTRLYGASYMGAGFTLDGTLAPGTYDLVVYAHDAATNGFEGAQSVRVTIR